MNIGYNEIQYFELKVFSHITLVKFTPRLRTAGLKFLKTLTENNLT